MSMVRSERAKPGRAPRVLLVALAGAGIAAAAPRAVAGSTTGHWRFEEGTADAAASGASSVLDGSGSSDHGTPAGGPIYRADPAANPVPQSAETNGLSLELDGSDDEVAFTSTFPLNGAGDATIEFWLNVTPALHQTVIWSRADGADTNRFNIFVNSNGTLGVEYRSPLGDLHSLIGDTTSAGVALPSGSWVHVAITRTGDEYRVYIDGVLRAAAQDCAPDLPDAAGWSISGRSTNRFAGRIDEIRLSSTALLPDELLVSPPPAGEIVCDGSSSGACFLPIADLTGSLFLNAAFGLSPDGLAVAGYGTPAETAIEATRWDVGGTLPIGRLAPAPGTSSARAVSNGGESLVGGSGPSGQIQAYRWTLCDGMVALGALGSPQNRGEARALTPDGAVIVGSAENALLQTLAFRWTQVGGMVSLGELAGGPIFSRASGISADGLVVVGESSAAMGTEAFRWTQAGGIVTLGELAGGAHLSVAFACSSDGSVIVGVSNSSNGTEAFRWTQAGGMIGLGDLPGGPMGADFVSRSLAVSADGNTIVGVALTNSGNTAFIWDQTNGMRNLREVLVNDHGLGAGLTDWLLRDATGVSADGRTICGNGVNPDGNLQAWVCHLPPPPPPPCPADCASPQDGAVDVSDLLALLAQWGGMGSCDTNNDNDVNVTDLLELLAAWGNCPT